MSGWQMIQKKSNIIALSLCLFSFFSIFGAVQGNIFKDLRFEGWALTSDEVSHIPAGYYYWTNKKYFINTEHPPLIKTISTLPLFFLKLNNVPISSDQKYLNIQWEFGKAFLFYSGNDPDLISLLARSSVLLLNIILLFLVYFLTKKNFNNISALLFLFLVVFSPNFAGHSSLVTFDVPLSLLCLLSIISFSSFLKDFIQDSQNFKNSNFLLSIFFTSLALLTKFQAIFLFLSLFLGGIIYIIAYKKSLFKKYIYYFFLFSLLVVFIIGCYQGFFTQQMDKKGLTYQLKDSYPPKFPKIGENILLKLIDLDFWILNGILEYLIGIFMMITRVVGAGQSTYFLGHIYGSEGAGPLYFPILFFTKETPGFLLMLGLSIYVFISRFFKNKKIIHSIKNFFQNPFNSVSFCFLVIYLIFSLTMKLNIGVRHIFPIVFLSYLLVAVFSEKILKEKIIFLKKELNFSLIFLVFIFSIIFSYLTTWPYFLSYYNILAGGTQNGYQIATDSNYDWAGQDVKKLAKWIKDNNIEKIYVQVFSNTRLEYYLGKSYQPFNIRFDPLPPSKSLIAVSAFELQNTNYDKNLSFSKKYFQLEPYLINRIGTTIFIFQIP